MTKNDKIHIKLEICKDENSNELKIMTHFDSNAPNFFREKNSFLWIPTIEEKDFINEAFDLIPTGRLISQPKKTYPETPTPEIPEIPEVHPPEEKGEKSRIIHSPFGRKKEEKTSEPTPKEKTRDETVFEITREESKSDNADIKMKVKEDVFVKADDTAIEEALKKHDEDDETIVEADEKTIIEKVLSQKKKGRWNKEN